jgi:lipopolysaccharide export LptBFGC system permease protein LptF
MPFANREQDSLRSQIRGGLTTSVAKEGQVWIAGRTRLYSFTPEDRHNLDRTKDLRVYEMDESGTKLARVLRIPEASWREQQITMRGKVESLTWSQNRLNLMTFSPGADAALAERENPFEQIYTKATHLSAAETLERIRQTDSQAERQSLEVNLQRKYAAPFLPLVIMLFTAPFALTLGRRRRVVTIGLAIGVWLIFLGLSNTFEQFGISGQLSAKLAVWNPLVLFSVLGAYLLTRVRT